MARYILSDNSELYIRTAEEKDSSEIVEMFSKIGAESDNLSYGEGEYYFNIEQEKQFIRTISERRNSIFIVAVLNGRIVGNLSFAAMQRGRLSHRGDMGISVLQDYWGLGIGSALIDYFLKWAVQNGEIKKIELEVREDNFRAIKLYSKWGFNIEGKILRGMQVDNIYYDLYHMGKIIGG